MDNVVNAGQVIVATNIAGRGTDLRLSKMWKRMAVCMFASHFCPQMIGLNLGRTSRVGNKGTSQFILNCKIDDYNDYIFWRDLMEEEAPEGTSAQMAAICA